MNECLFGFDIMSEYGTVLVEKKDKIATIILNRPAKMNAIDFQIPKDLYDALIEIENDGLTKVVVLKGAGRCFSSGFDLTPPDAEGFVFPEGGMGAFVKLMWANYLKPLKYMLTYPKPIIGLVHGYCLGAGIWIMASCDMVIASKECKFGFPEIRHGAETILVIVPANMRRNVWLEHALTGTYFSAKEAERFGMINRAVPMGRLGKEVYNLAKRIALVDPVTLEQSKKVANQFFGIPQLEGLIDYAIENGIVGFLLEKEVDRRLMKPLMAGTMSLKEWLKKRDGPFQELEKELEEIRKT
jgi:enoyl-CoA hydratase